jgi:hypothetical protein
MHPGSLSPPTSAAREHTQSYTFDEESEDRISKTVTFLSLKSVSEAG